jgi:viroplasmin and RNaseH domain-containing protein
MMQNFIVAWVNGIGKDRFRVFDSLTEAEEFMNGLTIEDSYVYLSVEIKRQ